MSVNHNLDNEQNRDLNQENDQDRDQDLNQENDQDRDALLESNISHFFPSLNSTKIEIVYHDLLNIFTSLTPPPTAAASLDLVRQNCHHRCLKFNIVPLLAILVFHGKRREEKNKEKKENGVMKKKL